MRLAHALAFHYYLLFYHLSMYSNNSNNPNHMKKLLLIMLVCVGCKHQYKMPEESELAIVVGKQYTPYQSTMGTGISSRGSLVVTSSSTPERYDVIVKCFKHNSTFNFESKDWFAEVKEGDTLILDYCPIVNSDSTRIVDFDLTAIHHFINP